MRAKSTQALKLKTADLNADREHLIDRPKILVGRSDNCDIVLSEQSISDYHALLVFLPEEEMIKVIDLESSEGVFVNGQLVSTSIVTPGDYLKFGELSFVIDQGTQKVDGSLFKSADPKKRDAAINSPLILPKNNFNPNLKEIDGELCDIVFDSIDHSDDVSTRVYDVDVSQYIELSDQQELDQIENGTEEEKDARLFLEITTLTHGNIVDIDILQLKKNRTFSLSNLGIYGIEETQSFLEINKGQVQLYIPAGVSFSTDEEPFQNLSKADRFSLTENKKIALKHLGIELGFQLIRPDQRAKRAPLFSWDKQLGKSLGQTFGLFFIPFLLLLLVDKQVEKIKSEKTPVIYKVKVNQPKRSLDSGPSPSANKMPEPVKAQNQVAKANKKVKAKKIAKSVTKSRPVKKPVPKFNFKSKFSFLKKKVAANNRVPASAKNLESMANANAVNINSAAKGLKSVSGNSKGINLNKNALKAGNGNGFGAKGKLASSYIPTKTVVLGQIDPDLWRKILREYLPQFRHCYQNELQKFNSELKGIVDLNFRIGRNGKARNINIQALDAKFSKSGINCMAHVLKIIPFPRPKGGGHVDVRQPLNFSADKHKI